MCIAVKHIPRTKQMKINFVLKSENILEYSFVKKNKTNNGKIAKVFRNTVNCAVE